MRAGLPEAPFALGDGQSCIVASMVNRRAARAFADLLPAAIAATFDHKAAEGRSGTPARAPRQLALRYRSRIAVRSAAGDTPRADRMAGTIPPSMPSRAR